MLPSTPVFLGRVAYVPEKRQIVAEFSNMFEKYSKRYSFFPRMFFPLRGISKESFRDAVAEYDLKRVKIDFEGETAVVFAATFSDLKKLNNLLSEFFGFHSNLIEPERQFLIEKGWGYLEPFSFSNGEPTRLGSFNFPNLQMDFLSGSLSESAADLLRSNKPLAQDLIGRIASSRILKIPLVGNDAEVSKEEIFLENIFFSSSMALSFGPKENKPRSHSVRRSAELDFSRLVSIVAAQPFNNIGFESMNCECCRPLSLSDKNVLASSLVRVSFLKEGFYFNSASAAWAQEFHDSHEDKEKRERRKREYFYDSYPLGPFGRGEEVAILLADALSLQADGSAVISGDSKPMWCCSKSESRLSQEINSLKAMLSALSERVESEQVSTVASKGLFFAQSLDSNPGFFFARALAKNISMVLSDLPSILANPQSRFFERNVAVSIECLKAGIVKELDSLASSSGSAIRLAGNSQSIFLNHSEALGICRRFSELYRLGKPFIRLKAGL